jgi:hypothetical protein
MARAPWTNIVCGGFAWFFRLEVAGLEVLEENEPQFVLPEINLSVVRLRFSRGARQPVADSVPSLPHPHYPQCQAASGFLQQSHHLDPFRHGQPFPNVSPGSGR